MKDRSRLNRAFIVFAVIVSIPGFHLGANLYQEMFRTTVYGKSIELISYPPDWQCNIAGAATSLFVFLLVLFGLRSSLRLAKRVCGGFKDKQNSSAEVPSWPY